MTRNGYNLLASLALVCAVVVAVVDKELLELSLMMVGLAGTVAGRGEKA